MYFKWVKKCPEKFKKPQQTHFKSGYLGHLGHLDDATPAEMKHTLCQIGGLLMENLL